MPLLVAKRGLAKEQRSERQDEPKRNCSRAVANMTQEFQQLTNAYTPRCHPAGGIIICISHRLSVCVCLMVSLILASCISSSGKAVNVSELKSVVISVEDLDA